MFEKTSRTVLVVDDDCSIRQLVGAILESNGFTVLLAQDGLEALELSRKHPQPIDILLSDIEMPRMDGFVLSRILGKERPELAFVLMSGCATEKEQIPAGAVFLAKPFSEDVLILRLRQSLGAAGRSRSTFSSSAVDVA